MKGWDSFIVASLIKLKKSWLLFIYFGDHSISYRVNIVCVNILWN